jgi:sec-independent protein translocase protein TatA
MGTLLFLSLPQGSEFFILALIILLLFGGKKIPELMRGLGKGVRSFKEGLKDMNEEIKKEEPADTNKKDTDSAPKQ